MKSYFQHMCPEKAKISLHPAQSDQSPRSHPPPRIILRSLGAKNHVVKTVIKFAQSDPNMLTLGAHVPKYMFPGYGYAGSCVVSGHM